MNLNELKYKAAKVSDKLFGRDNPVTAPIRKLKGEVDELLDCLDYGHDPAVEFADCFLLLIDAYRKHYGDEVDMQQLIDDSSEKLDVVSKRKWGEPDEHGVFQHIDEDDGDPFDMSVHSAGSGFYLSESIPHDQPRTWTGLDMNYIQEVRQEVFEVVAFELITKEIREKIYTMMKEKLPYYKIKCDEENNPPDFVANGNVMVRVTDPSTRNYVDVIF